MKLNIEKSGEVYTVVITTDITKKPIALKLTQGQIDGLISMLAVAEKMGQMKFTLEL